MNKEMLQEYADKCYIDAHMRLRDKKIKKAIDKIKKNPNNIVLDKVIKHKIKELEKKTMERKLTNLEKGIFENGFIKGYLVEE